MRNVRSTTQTSVAVLKSAAKGVMVAIEGVRVRVRARERERERERERKKEREREKERKREKERERGRARARSEREILASLLICITLAQCADFHDFHYRICFL